MYLVETSIDHASLVLEGDIRIRMPLPFPEDLILCTQNGYFTRHGRGLHASTTISCCNQSKTDLEGMHPSQVYLV